MTPTALLQRLRESPWARWLGDARLGLEAEDRWVIGLDRVVPWTAEPVDAWLSMSAEDLDRMLAREAPVDGIRMKVADRERADRVKWAHATLALATLGWCGPWPDPAADVTHDAMMREAIFQLALGPADGAGALFPAEAPVPPMQVRFTDGARPAWATVGLFPVVGAELVAYGKHAPVRAMRALVLDALAQGSFARELVTPAGTLVTTQLPLPLATRVGALVTLG